VHWPGAYFGELAADREVMGASQAADEVERGALAELQRHPEGLIVAMGADGLVTPMPDSVGVPPSRLIRVRSIVQVVAPEDRVAAIEAYQRAQVTGAARTVVHLALPSRQLATLSFSDARAEHGVFLAAVVARAGPADYSAQLSGLAPVAPRVAWAHKNATGTLVEADVTMCRMFGWTAGQLVGRSSLEFVHPDDRERAVDSYVQMLATPGQACRGRFRHRCADGAWKWVEVSNTNLLDDPAAGYVLAEVLDISDEMAAVEELRAREQLLHRLAEALPAGVVQLDAAGNVVYANERAGDVLGAQGATGAGSLFSAVAEADRARLESALAEALGYGADRDLEVGVSPAQGVARYCQVAIRALTADDGSATGAIVCCTDVTDAARLRAELERRATTDMPTGCRNRSWLMARLAELVESDEDLAVVYVDLDDFKSVNDRFGHAAGDEVLVTVAERLGGATRAGDAVGRMGGDEFLVVCPNAGGLAGAQALADRVTDALGRHGRAADVGARRRVVLPLASVGLAYSGGRHLTADQLVAEADLAMYRAKDMRHAGLAEPVLSSASPEGPHRPPATQRPLF
jgi:diguanylate cyclase (GGDEF)-like protein/PAS domain S-box-containing protein